MKIVYVGPSPSVDVGIPGGCIRAVHGTPVDVPDVLGKSLLEQDVFEAAKEKK
jgi:hypothetical protein